MEKTTETTSNPIRVNGNVLNIMNMNRKNRRRIARFHGLKNIPSIVNAKITKLEDTSHEKRVTL